MARGLRLGIGRVLYVADAIVVLNAGSSSIKFSLFSMRSSELELELHGQIEGIYTAPRFIAKDRSGATIADQPWNGGTDLGHDAALDRLFEFLRFELKNCRLIGVGHRVLHGGLDHVEPVVLNPAVAATLEKLVPWRRCTSRTAWPRSNVS